MQENPFTVRGMIQNPKDFIGRKAEISHIISRLKTMQSCSVVGERRIGKSSLLYHLFQTGNERLDDANVRFVYIELTDASTQTLVDFLHTVLQALNLPVDSIKDDNKPNRNLVAFDNAIKMLVADGVNVVLCLDEFEGLFAYKSEFNDGFFNHLRAMVNQRRLSLVIASRRPLEVYAIEEKLTSPFFNLLSITELDSFTTEEAETFIDHYQPLAQFDRKELEFINWYSDPHPLKLQIFCEKMLEWRVQDWGNDAVLEETAKVYGQFFGGKHDWRKLRRVTTLFSVDGFGKILADIKTARDLAVGK